MTKETFYNEFKEPPIFQNENFRRTINATFIVTNEGQFKLIYINSHYKELETEVERVFKAFPRIEPAKYSNHNVEMQFIFPLVFPLIKGTEPEIVYNYEPQKEDINEVVKKTKQQKILFPKHRSQLNIPFTHQRYTDYEFALHKANGTHTASKPYMFNEINNYINLDSVKSQFLKPDVSSWTGRKIWNEHLLSIQEEDYWFTMNFLLDV